MDRVLRLAINLVNEDLDDYWDEFKEVPPTDESDPYTAYWNELPEQKKYELLKHLKENPNNEDFGHSQLCKPLHQAAAYYCCCRLADSLYEGDFMDDLDFVINLQKAKDLV